MKRPLLAALVVLLLPTVAPAATGGGPAWAASFEQACRDAESSHKIVLVDVYTTWCAPCHALDERTWPDATVQKWLGAKAVAVKVDAEKLVDLAARYKITSYPTILLLRPDGTEIDRLLGFREPAALISDATDALAGKDAVARAKAKVDASGGNDPLARLRYARALVQKGRNEEALAEYVWCFDHGAERDPSFADGRLVYLLSDIATLGKKGYAPATDALVLRRDAAEARVRAGTTDRDSALVLAAIDGALGDEARTLAIYDELKAKSPATRALLFDSVVDGLLSARRYADVVEGGGDPAARIARDVDDVAQSARSHEGEHDAEQIVTSNKQYAVWDGGKSYETLLGLGRLDDAAKAADALVALSPTGETYATLVRAATHAGKPDVARALVARGLANLPESEHPPLREAAGEIAAAARRDET